VPPVLNVLNYGGLDLRWAYGGAIAGVRVAGTLHLDNREEQDQELGFGHKCGGWPFKADLRFKGDLPFKAVFHLMPAPGKPLPRAGVRTGHYVGLRRGNTLAPFVLSRTP
jgi:hypothetical protein